MANTKISALTNGNPAQSGDLIPIARAGSNFSITAGSVTALATKSITVHLTSSDILALNSIPFEIVPAPGPGKVIVPSMIKWSYVFDTQAYVGGSDLFLILNANSNTFIFSTVSASSVTNTAIASGFIEMNESVKGITSVMAAEDTFGYVLSNPNALMTNIPLMIFASGAGFTIGDGTLDISVVYTIEDMP